MGTDHTLAPLALRERLALDGEAADLFLQRLVAMPAIEEAAILSTCNRVEVYAASHAPDQAARLIRAALAATLDAPMPDLQRLLVARQGMEALRHLCSVAAGLQSMVLAEGQILGQVREAIARAQRLETAGAQLAATFRAAIACGKRVRAETPLGRTDFSIGSVLIDLLAREIADWPAQRVLLLGAGRMNEITAARLHALGAGAITVASRTLAAAERLADAIGGQAIPLDAAAGAARRASLIVSATRSPNLTLTAPMLDARAPDPLLVVDLAVPRDVDPAVAALPGVRLLDIDDLRGLQDRRGLSEALDAADRIVAQAARDWQAWCRTRAAVPLIADLRAHVDRQKEAELARTLARLDHLSPADREEVREMAHRLVNKMFHHLAIRMKKAAADPDLGEHYLDAARYLFQPEESATHTDAAMRPLERPGAAVDGAPA